MSVETPVFWPPLFATMDMPAVKSTIAAEVVPWIPPSELTCLSSRTRWPMTRPSEVAETSLMVGIRMLYGWEVVIFVAHTCSTWLNTEAGALEGVESAMVVVRLGYIETIIERV